MNLRSFCLGLFAAAALLLAPALARAQTTVVDQIPAPVPSASNAAGNSEWLLQSYGITGGTIYQSFVRQPGTQGGIRPGGMLFVPSSTGGFQRFQALTNAKSDAGVALTASATAGAMGVARTAGTSLDLVGETTSSSAKTDKAIWELNVADSFVAGTAIPVIINANYTGGGTVTAASTTLTLAAYTEVNGVETAISGITAAQQFTGTATNYTFSIPSSAGLVAGQHIVIEIVMLVTTSAGGATGQVNSLSLTM